MLRGASIKCDRGWGRPRIRNSASEKLEIIRTVGQSHLPVRHTLARIRIPRATPMSVSVGHKPSCSNDNASKNGTIQQRRLLNLNQAA